MRNRTITLMVLALSLGVGCKSLGPGTVPRDRLDYSRSMTESWKRQTLLNIVRLRYYDPPSFVDVGQIVAGYSLETGVTAEGQVARVGAGDQYLGLGGRVIFTDRPTITYTPLTGNRFIRGLMTPVPPESLFFAIQSGWAAQTMLRVAAVAINGLKNEEISPRGYRPPDTNFLRVVELISRIQLSGAVALKVVQDSEKHETKILTLRTRSASAATLRDIAELRALLGLDPVADEFQLVWGLTAANNHELAVQTRSLLQMLAAMAARTEVPPEDVREGRVALGIEGTTAESQQTLRPTIRCTKERPKQSFVEVEYRDHWFWIDDRDLESKRTFSFLMLLFTLADTSERENLPLITIPAQ